MTTPNAWKYVRVDPERIRRNRYVHPPATSGGGAGAGAGNPPPNPARVINAGDYLKLENLVCVDADGNEFERYGELYVKKDVEKDITGAILKVTPYNAIIHCEQQNMFLPSAALMANIHVAVYHAAVELKQDGSYRVKDLEAEKMLKKLKDRGDGVGGHWVNTLVNWSTSQIVHYPLDSDFPSNGGTNSINSSHARKTYAFDKTDFGDNTLADALKLPNFKRYLQNYSGLADPAVLLDVAKYHGQPARCWVSSSQETRAAWFGCYSNNFSLYAISDLDNFDAGRGVRSSAP